MENSIHLPSAGLNRFRFDGSAFASQPSWAPRGDAEDTAPCATRKPKSLEQRQHHRYAAPIGVRHEPEHLRSSFPRHHLG
jgi:hypothetical protein